MEDFLKCPWSFSMAAILKCSKVTLLHISCLSFFPCLCFLSKCWNSDSCVLWKQYISTLSYFQLTINMGPSLWLSATYHWWPRFVNVCNYQVLRQFLTKANAIMFSLLKFLNFGGKHFNLLDPDIDLCELHNIGALLL